MKELDDEHKQSLLDTNARQRTSGTGTPKVIYTVFGIFMIVIYVGMGVLLLLNFFRWEPNWAWIRYTAAGMFILYGIWRAYRQFKGIDSNI